MPQALRSLLLLLVFALPLRALPLIITPDSGTENVSRWTGLEHDNPGVLVAIRDYVDSSPSPLYKDNYKGSEEGSYPDAYRTSYTKGGEDATIVNTGGIIPDTFSALLLIKGGNHSPGWYLFDLTALGWNGTDDVDISSLWPHQGSISYVALYTRERRSVPEGGTTLGVLGLALVGIGYFGRKFQRAGRTLV